MNKELKIALVFENLFSWGGAGLVNKNLCEIFPGADIYALFGNQDFSNRYFDGRKIRFSFLNKFPFVKNLYTYYLPLWPVAIESFDLSNYDLVISSSHWVAKGAITSENAVHISYIHTPMRFLWDQKDLYSKYDLLKAPFLNYLRIWDVSSAGRPERLIANSEFVSKRCKRYWDRESDTVIYPPVSLYDGRLIDYKDRENYFVSGAPFAENKGGEFLVECAKELGFMLKIVGRSRGYKKLKRKARGVRNIEFLGKVSEENKWDILSKAKGYLGTGIEDFGIFPVEAMSCGTPVLALKKGGYLESVVDGVNGVLYKENTVEEFEKGLQRLVGREWDVNILSKSVGSFNVERFEKEVRTFVNNI